MSSLLTDLMKIVRQLQSKHYGNWSGIVTDVNDPEQLNRVKVRIPAVHDENEIWVRVLVPFGGDEVGWSFLPDVGDEVAISFRGGNTNFPECVGFYYSPELRPPTEATPTRRLIKSKSGHLVVLDDTEGEEAVQIQHANGSMILINADGVTVLDVNNNFSVVSESISLGSQDESAEPVVLGNALVTKLVAFLNAFINHVHPSPGGVTSTPVNAATAVNVRQTINVVKSTQNTTD